MVWYASWKDGPSYRSQVFVNRRNYTTERYGPDVWAFGYFLANERGDIAVGLSPSPGGPYDLWVGDRNVSGPVIPPSENGGVAPVALTDDGRLFWNGTKRFGGVYYDDWYFEDVNLSKDLLGPVRQTRGLGHLFVNRSGQYAWSGQGDLTGRQMNVFLGQLNYSASVLGPGQHVAYLIGIDEAGSVFWYGGGVRDVDVKDVYRNGENLSEFLGPTRKTSSSDPGMVSRSGHVLWVGSSDLFGAGNYDLFLDRTNLSHELLGQQRHARPVGFAGETPVWFGWGTQDTGLFIGSHNLTREAGVDPMTLFSTDSIAVNARGDVLWLTQTTVGFDLWLSRPVAEPSVMWALLIPLLLRVRGTRKADH